MPLWYLKERRQFKGKSNLVKAREILTTKRTIQHEEADIQSLTDRLAHAVSHISDLEKTLSEKDKLIMSLVASYTCSVQKCVEYQASASAWESKYLSVHHDLRMRQQAEK